MSRMTPQIGATGIYELKTPWTTEFNVIYTCEAIRSFNDCYLQGLDVYSSLYVTNSLDEATYQADVQANVHIVTLTSKLYPTIYVPDSYILSYPDSGYAPYRHIVISATLGLISDQQDLSFLQTQISNLISDLVGVDVPVNINEAPTLSALTEQEIERLETNRLNAIATRDTDYGKLKRAENTIATLQDKVATLENYILNE